MPPDMLHMRKIYLKRICHQDHTGEAYSALQLDLRETMSANTP